VFSEFRQVRTCAGLHAILEVQSMHPVDADEEHMASPRVVSVGGQTRDGRDA
jgi:hypothetical protein